MARTHNTGKAGQFAVMAELALRGYNVAIPEIDIGDDVFVLNDDTGRLSRIQVKTGTGKKLSSYDRAYRCQYSVRDSHVSGAASQGVHYVLAGRCGKSWRFLVLERGVLNHLMNNGWGTKMKNGSTMLSVVFITRSEVKSSTDKTGIDLSAYASNWDAWPIID
ncbi:MAG: hypothetical protein KF826_03175 [Xanthobacteraceae bacterium]|nr:hypothetical protein [Xanthobacteraceae bacterium]MCW5679339.1 hypothetical protein [Xanthobacteraceae bacterium]